MPFVVLLQLRTGWNLTTVASLKNRRWMEPYPFRVGSHGGETHAWVVAYKTRGRRDKLSSSPVKRIPSARRPWSHPFRVIKFVEYLTAGLRREVRRRIHELSAVASPSGKQSRELSRLESLKDDLFIYRSDSAFNSLRGSTDRSDYGAFFRRAGVAVTGRQLREAALLFAYEESGGNLLHAQLMGSHTNGRTTALYLRRKRILDNMWQDAARVFELSLDLIRQDAFDVKALRAKLAKQGLTAKQMKNVTDPANITRWGNGCIDPKAPPPGFDHTRDVAKCQAQDCIDGCPHARWFSASLDHVVAQMVKAERQRRHLGLDALGASSHENRIGRCMALLSTWPADKVETALAAGRAAPPSPEDLLSGVPG